MIIVAVVGGVMVLLMLWLLVEVVVVGVVNATAHYSSNYGIVSNIVIINHRSCSRR